MERDDIRAARERKVEQLAALGLPYLPNRYGPTRSSEEIKRDFEALEGQCVRVAGRLMRVRLMGKAAFAHIQDGEGELQLYFKRDVLGENQYDYFKLLDLGDIVGVEGTVFKTRTGEISVQAESVVLLAKAYLSLPDKWHGLSDVETRYRRRYLDLISNPDSRRILRMRSEIIGSIRRFLDARGFTEVETPILQPLYGGGAARPFTTRYEALDMNVYLRIATELYLKRLIVGGMERVYEIGKDFRNEGLSYKHSPEFTMLELYQAYADYRDIMELIEAMISTVAEDVLGTQRVTVDGKEICLSPPWARLSIRDALLKYGAIDLAEYRTRESLLDVVRSHNISVSADASRGKMIEELVSVFVEPHLIQPTILCDFPVDFPGGLFAKRSKADPEIVERFEVYIGGRESGNAFTELNDPRDQLLRMEEAARLGGEEHAQVDRDYVRALEYGMPPTGGIGLGIDRFVMLLTGSHHIRETILFPLLRWREDVDVSS